MKRHFYLCAMLFVGLMPFAGCIDNDIDLENIDTTAEVKVVDLTDESNGDALHHLFYC